MNGASTNMMAQQEACNTREAAKCSPAPILEAAPAQQKLLNLAFLWLHSQQPSLNPAVISGRRRGCMTCPLANYINLFGSRNSLAYKSHCPAPLHALHKELRHIVCMLRHTDLWGLSPMCEFSPKHHKYSIEL